MALRIFFVRFGDAGQQNVNPMLEMVGFIVDPNSYDLIMPMLWLHQREESRQGVLFDLFIKMPGESLMCCSP
jgi:hypothetical protein